MSEEQQQENGSSAEVPEIELIIKVSLSSTLFVSFRIDFIVLHIKTMTDE